MRNHHALWALIALVWADGPRAGVAPDGCKECIDQQAGNCYHASWPGKSYDKCSKEKNETECSENDNGVWCLDPPGPGPNPHAAGQCCQHCKHTGHCHNHCNTTTSKAACSK
jgi:hypothetical protein